MAGVNRAGFSRLRFDKIIYTLEEVEDLTVDKQKKHNVEIVIDRLKVSKDKEDLARLTESVEKALELGNGLVTIAPQPSPYQGAPSPFKGEGRGEVGEVSETTYSQRYSCPDCGINLTELEPHNFSFNSPHGACPNCTGLGTKLEVDPKLILNPNLTIAQGAIRAWAHSANAGQGWLMRILGTVAADHGFDLNTPVKT